MRFRVLLALIPLAVVIAQDDSDLLRAAKLKAIGDWVGQWKAEMVILDSQFKGLKVAGDLNIKWDLDNTFLRFDGWAKLDPSIEGGSNKKMTYTGHLTFNHAAPYDQQAYSAVFFWSEDGRMILAKGDFKGKELRMDVAIHPERPEHRLAVRVVGTNPRRIIVSVPPSGSYKAADWMEITLRRP